MTAAAEHTWVALILPAIAVLLSASTLLLLGGASRRWARNAALALCAAASLAIGVLAIVVLSSNQPLEASAGRVLGFALIELRYDALSTPFLAALAFVGTAASIYGLGYATHDAKSRSRVFAAYPVFLGSLLLVFGAADAFAFLLAWEVMALSSAALVFGPAPSRSVARAGYLYLAMTHVASAALIVAFAILGAEAGSTSFADFGHAASALSDPLRDLVFVLLLIGFGTKAGAIPMHVWLPKAHPVAPSHVSALMSGVMIKAGIYGLVRLGIEVLGPGAEWWGLLVLGIGAVSAVLGVLYALMEHDLKRLLAFHSIENVGIILIGIGVAMLALTHGAVALAGLALAAALFHTFNHALFKSALFLAAGSVQAAVGQRDLDRLGGLARLMPVTTLAFALAAAAISGVPPLNGFASEWLTFQSLIGVVGSTQLSPVAQSAGALTVGALGLTAALAVACFVKATGIAFLGRPRTPAAAAARESGLSMRIGMGLLVGACVVVGLAAGSLAPLISEAAAPALGTPPAVGSAPAALTVLPALGGPTYAALPLGALLLGATGVTWLALRSRGPVRRSPTWTCGIAPEPAFEYSATSFAKLIRLYFSPILRPEREITVDRHPGTPFARSVHYRGEVQPLLGDRSYARLHGAVVAAAELVRRLQSGSLQLYLAYAVVALVILLLVAR